LRHFLFEMIGGHFFLAATVDYHRSLSSELLGLRDRINGRVTAADHCDTRPDWNLMQWLRMDLLNEIQRLNHLGKIFAWDVHLCSTAQSESYKNCIELLFDFCNRNVFAYLDSTAKLHPQVFDQLNFRQAHLWCHFVIRDPVRVQTPWLRFLLEND